MCQLEELLALEELSAWLFHNNVILKAIFNKETTKLSGNKRVIWLKEAGNIRNIKCWKL